MRVRTRVSAIGLGMVLMAFGVAACGDDDDGASATSAAAPATTAPATSAEAPASSEATPASEEATESTAEATESTAEATESSVTSEPASTEPIILGYAFDSTGNMAPFDNPALAAAKVEVQALNDKGGVAGRQLELITCDTQNNKPEVAKSCAADLLDKGAAIMITTCDVDFATPVVQEAIDAGVLAVAPCIGTDQMGPKRFGDKGRLAFSFGNAAQDEGAAMAEWAYNTQGWKTAALATNNLLVYFKNVTAAFENRFTELGGKVVARESFTTGNNDVGTAVGRLNGAKADVIVTATAFGELPGLVQGLRSLGNETPILNSWAGDGTYWVPKKPKVTNYYAVTYASVFGDDPSPEVQALIKTLADAGVQLGTGGFVTGAATIDGIAAAIEAAGGSTTGSDLADQMEQFTQVPTISGNVNFTPELHSVFGRAYRVIEIEDNVGKYIGDVTASSPADL